MAGQTIEKREVKKGVKRDAALPKKKAVPEKRTLNLVIREKQSIDPKKWIPGILAVLLLAALFGKFAVADRYAKLEKAENELAAMQQKLDDTRAAYADYDEVQEQYNMYNYTGYDKTLADRLDIIDLLERKVFPACDVTSLAISGKTVSMSLENLDLSQVSSLIADLEAEPLVDRVYVPTASHGNEQELGSAAMTMYLVDADTIEKDGEANE